MNPWVESFGAVLLAAGGVLLGAWFSRLPKPYWLIGYLLPLFIISLFALARREPALAFVPPISWMMLGRTQFALTGFVGAMILTIPLLKLPQKRDRIAIAFLMVCIVSMMSVWPFLAPAFNRAELSSITTRFDPDGVCLQNTSYTCGPASAVTALRKLGFQADEGEIAILAHTSSAIGSPPDVLAEALNKRYGHEGLTAENRLFTNLTELRSAGLTLAVIKFSFMLDHYVTVLEVTDTEVVVGDPLNGLTKLSYADFNDKWRFEGVVLHTK
jgi:peptidase C39-like protein